VRLPEGATASGEIRGGSPASREFELLDPVRRVGRLDAVVLSGGSAFGLAAGSGVADALGEAGIGFETPHGVVPIVVGMSLYDLGVGDASVRPNAEHGRLALRAATAEPAVGRVGAGTGATVGKWRGPDHAIDAGLGIATMTDGELAVSAVVAVNAVGDIDDGSDPARIRHGVSAWPLADDPLGADLSTNTVIGVVVTNAVLDAGQCLVVAQGAHDGLARAVFPPHMRSDGDGFVAAATGEVEAPVDQVRMLAVVAVETAIRSTVGSLEG
jgi:L-aminopeptidase/D-esterase-like protein